MRFRPCLLQGARIKNALLQRQLLRSVLTSSAESLAQAQAGLEASEEVHAVENLAAFARSGTDENNAISEALQKCAAAETSATNARGVLERPLTCAWFQIWSKGKGRRSDTAGSAEEENAVEVAQRAAAEAEGAAARLTEKLRQIGEIRAKLRLTLADSESRFRRASAVLADGGGSDRAIGVDRAGQVASEALERARARLQNPVVSGYLVTGDGGSSGGYGYGYGGELAKDEEAVSEAQGYVRALEMFATSAVEANARANTNAREDRSDLEPNDTIEHTAPTSVDSSKIVTENVPIATDRDALALALTWWDALRAQVAELRLGADPAVARSVEAAGNVMLTAEKLWSASEPGKDSGADAAGRAAVEYFAAELGKLEKVAGDATERRREREAGLGVATRRLDHLMTTLSSLRETVTGAGEPLVSLTADAMRAAFDKTHSAAATAPTSCGKVTPGEDAGKSVHPDSAEIAAFVDAVQEAAVAVVQAEVMVNRSSERASQVSAERVRALETLVGLAETLSEAGDRAATVSSERGLSYSRKAAASISEARAALSSARAAAQANVGEWVSGAVAIVEEVSRAEELVKVAKRAADGHAVLPPMTSGRDSIAVGLATEKVIADVESHDKAQGKGNGRASTPGERKEKASAARNEKETSGSTQRPRIGFSSKGEGAPKYLPLWIRLQEKAWRGADDKGDDIGNGGGHPLQPDGEGDATADASVARWPLPPFSDPPQRCFFCLT